MSLDAAYTAWCAGTAHNQRFACYLGLYTGVEHVLGYIAVEQALHVRFLTYGAVIRLNSPTQLC